MPRPPQRTPASPPAAAAPPPCMTSKQKPGDRVTRRAGSSEASPELHAGEPCAPELPRRSSPRCGDAGRSRAPSPADAVPTSSRWPPRQQRCAACPRAGVCQGPRDSSEAQVLRAERRVLGSAAAALAAAAALHCPRAPLLCNRGVAALPCEAPAAQGRAASVRTLSSGSGAADVVGSAPGVPCTCVAATGGGESSDDGDCSSVSAGDAAPASPTVAPAGLSPPSLAHRCRPA